jgi:hypothetical protein
MLGIKKVGAQSEGDQERNNAGEEKSLPTRK